MFELGRLCIKTAGRDAGEYCVIIEEIDEKYVLIDGNTRRKKTNKLHLEPLSQKLNIKKGAKREEILNEFEKLDIKIKKRGEKRTPKPQEKKN